MINQRQLIAITIPTGSWVGKKNRIMERYGHLREQDLTYHVGQEEALVERLQTLLFMARRAVIDLLHAL